MTAKWPDPEPDHYLVKLDHHPDKGNHLFRISENVGNLSLEFALLL